MNTNKTCIDFTQALAFSVGSVGFSLHSGVPYLTLFQPSGLSLNDHYSVFLMLFCFFIKIKYSFDETALGYAVIG